MNEIKGYNSTAASGEYSRLPAGGYIIKITKVEDVPDKQYLRIVFDIAEGPERGHFKDEEHDYRHSFVRSYKETALGMFKAFIKAVDTANETNFNDFIEKGFDEQLLNGCRLGVLLGYEEYEANDGNVKERLRLAAFKTLEQIRTGDFSVPSVKRLEESISTSGPVPGFTPLNDAEVPF